MESQFCFIENREFHASNTRSKCKSFKKKSEVGILLTVL